MHKRTKENNIMSRNRLSTNRLPRFSLSAIIVSLLLTAAMAIIQPRPAAAAERAGDIWGADYFPNVPLTSHEGETLRFWDDVVKDKVVMINFIFTRCPDVCPLETARLLEVQKILGDRIGKDVFMYSITIDPEYDTPEVLRQYAERYRIGPGWKFLTGRKDDITLIRRTLGLYDEEEDNENLATHSLNMIMGNQRTGKWMKTSPFENPYVLATQVGSWLHNWKLPPQAKRNYAEAPKLRSISTGESLFRTRCAACHTIGVKEDSVAARRAIGPDLLGVTASRDRAWLTRWLMEPDKMLEEKDPLAMALLQAYNNLPMPNLSINAEDAEALLIYIEEESMAKAQQHDHAAHRHDSGESKHDGGQ
jgi:protein SCO1/2